MPIVKIVQMTRGLNEYMKHTQRQYAKAMYKEGEYPTLKQAQEVARNEAAEFYSQSKSSGYKAYDIKDHLTGKNVGCIAMSISNGDPKKAFLIYLEVDKKYQRKGYAESALIMLEKILLKSDVVAIELSVMTHNRAANRLYEKLDYACSKRWRSGFSQHFSRSFMVKKLN